MKKKGQVWEEFIPWAIGIAVLIIGLGIYVILTGKGNAALEYLMNLFRFGGN